jgi:hypothetical protein
MNRVEGGPNLFFEQGAGMTKAGTVSFIRRLSLPFTNMAWWSLTVHNDGGFQGHLFSLASRVSIEMFPVKLHDLNNSNWIGTWYLRLYTLCDVMPVPISKLCSKWFIFSSAVVLVIHNSPPLSANFIHDSVIFVCVVTLWASLAVQFQ